MNLLKSEKRRGITDWRTGNGQFSGILVDAISMTETESKERIQLKAGALLAVPKDRQGERPSINKHSPLIAQADTSEELGPLISAWADKNAHKKPWDFRTD